MHKYTLLEKVLFPSFNLNIKKLKLSLEGKTVLITGASSGIGEKLAYQMSDISVHMILVARTEEKLLAIKKEIEKKTARVSVFRADIRNKEEVEGLISFIEKLPDGLDIIVSNAGKSIMRSVFDSLDRYNDFTRTMAVNYFAPVQLLLSVIPILEKNHGHIINISTINVLLVPFPYWAAYEASKAAFDAWFRAAEPELNSKGISTTSIYLPLVKTPMIVPTHDYNKLPAMTSLHAAEIVCSYMYTKKKKFKPWWLIFGQLSSVIFRGVWDALVPYLLKKRSNKNV